MATSFPRPVDDVLREAEKLVRGGVRELLVVSRDTSAYGVDVKYAERSWRDKQYQTRMKALCEGPSELARGRGCITCIPIRT